MLTRRVWTGGSSPRMRGALMEGRDVLPVNRDHPRVCGEHP